MQSGAGRTGTRRGPLPLGLLCVRHDRAKGSVQAARGRAENGPANFPPGVAQGSPGRAELVHVYDRQEISRILVPGRVLTYALRDPRTHAKMLAAGTVLTPRLIRLLHETQLAAEAAACVGGRVVVSGPSGEGSDPSLQVEQRRRLHEAMASLRTLAIVGALAAAAFGLLSGSLLDLETAMGAAAFLLMAFVASFGVAARTRVLLQVVPVRSRTPRAEAPIVALERSETPEPQAA